MWVWKVIIFFRVWYFNFCWIDFFDVFCFFVFCGLRVLYFFNVVFLDFVVGGIFFLVFNLVVNFSCFDLEFIEFMLFLKIMKDFFLFFLLLDLYVMIFKIFRWMYWERKNYIYWWNEMFNFCLLVLCMFVYVNFCLLLELYVIKFLWLILKLNLSCFCVDN